MIASGEGYYKVINKLCHECYALQSNFSTGNADHTTLLLVKKP